MVAKSIAKILLFIHKLTDYMPFFNPGQNTVMYPNLSSSHKNGCLQVTSVCTVRRENKLCKINH